MRIPEKNKKPGLCYAVTDDGVELPVIDITHPAFTVDPTGEQISAVIETTVRNIELATKMPPAELQAMAAGSILIRGTAEAAGTFMSGMNTYLNRLGPENLGEGYASPLDRAVAGGILPLSLRLRLQAMARSMADGLAPGLSAGRGRPLHLLSIGGGTAMDSLNALILIRREHPEWLAGRSCTIQVLDLDEVGPRFGARALDALLAPGGPLQGLEVTLRHLHFDWTESSRLRELLDERSLAGAVALGSSEGGVFEYAADEEIVDNLGALRQLVPPGFIMVGAVVRAPGSLDPRMRMMASVPGRPAARFLGLDAFRALAATAGWTIERSLEGPMHHVVSMSVSSSQRR